MSCEMRVSSAVRKVRAKLDKLIKLAVLRGEFLPGVEEERLDLVADWNRFNKSR
jgi:hypothetical protein